MTELTIKQLLEAGVHFGHQTQRWNPKMRKYIFGERNGIYIINLEVTLSCLQKALDFLRATAAEGREILLVGTKKQAQEHLRAAAEQCEMPYVEQRWLGGTLTNFETIRKSVSRLEQIDRIEAEGHFRFFKKKEILMMNREREKLLKNLRGLRKMKRLPGALFVIDSKKEEIAVKEAAKLGIPVVGVIDTNADPDLITYPVPGNDDAIRAIKLFCSLVSAAILEGRNRYKEAHQPAEPEAVAAAVAEAETPAEAKEGEMPAAEAVPAAGPDLIPLPEDTKEEKLAELFVPQVETPEDNLKIKKVTRKVK